MPGLCKRCKEEYKPFLGKTIYLPKRNHPDYQQVVIMRKNGKKINQIAEFFDITPRRVWQIMAQKN